VSDTAQVELESKRVEAPGARLAAAHRNIVNIYDVWSRTLLVSLRDQPKTVTSLAWAPDDSRLNTGGSGRGLHSFTFQLNLSRV